MKQDSTSSSVKLSKKQKEVIGLLREGYFLQKNVVTPGARWSLTKHGEYRWGNVNGHVINNKAFIGWETKAFRRLYIHA